MAYVQKPDNKDDQIQDNTSQQGGNQPSSGMNISGSSASDSAPSSGTSATSTAPQYSPAGTKSGSFQNVQNYLDANAGFNQDKGLAGKAYGTLKDQQQQQENAIGGASNEFQQQSSQVGEAYDPSKVSNFVQQATADPTTYASDPNNVAAYQKMLGAQYTGPQNLANAGDLQNNAQQFAQTTNLTTSEPGRMALLNKLYGGGAGNANYTSGQQSLDNLLMQGNPEQLNQLQSAQGLGGQVQSDFTNAQNNALQQAQKYGNWANQAQDVSGKALSTNATDLDTLLGTKASTAKTQQDTDYNRILGELKSGSISNQDLGALGLHPDDVSNLYGLPPDQIAGLLSKTQAATKQSVAGQGDVDKLNALAKLGGTYLPNVSTIAQDYSGNPSAIGSYKGPLDYDRNKLLGEVSAQKSAFENEYNPQQKLVENLHSSNPDPTTQAFIENYMGNNGGIGAFTPEAHAALVAQQQAALQAIKDKYGYGKGLTVT